MPIDQVETAEKVEHATKGIRARLATREDESLLRFRREV
ncbi:hypothetical protein ANO14919_038670 [Xylariales sp. No.14919]|nr:hypothetical protein ANO14919_038670 [Xylariales sp. No.14919]